MSSGRRRHEASISPGSRPANITQPGLCRAPATILGRADGSSGKACEPRSRKGRPRRPAALRCTPVAHPRLVPSRRRATATVVPPDVPRREPARVSRAPREESLACGLCGSLGRSARRMTSAETRGERPAPWGHRRRLASASRAANHLTRAAEAVMAPRARKVRSTARRGHPTQRVESGEASRWKTIVRRRKI